MISGRTLLGEAGNKKHQIFRGKKKGSEGGVKEKEMQLFILKEKVSDA